MCPKCNEEVPESDSGLTCADCDYTYHLDPCSGITEAAIKTKGSALRKSWRCPTCKIVKSRSGSQSARDGKEPNVAVMFGSINAKLESLMNLKETVDSIEISIQVMSSKYDGLLRKIGEQDKEVKKLQKRVEKLEEAEAEAEIRKLRQEVNELEWRSRQQNLEIHGIAKTDNEDLLEKVNSVAEKLDVPDVTMNEVAAVHRLPSRPDKIPGIIVRFFHQETKDQWLNKRSTLRKMKSNVYIQENLTKSDRALLWEAREWAKRTNYQYVWYRNGNVLVRKRDREQVHVIRSFDDLQKLT